MFTEQEIVLNIDLTYNTTPLQHKTSPHITHESLECRKDGVSIEKYQVLTIWAQLKNDCNLF
jgi:hypothetical protein